VAVIELDLAAPAAPAARRPPAHYYRWIGVLVAVILVLTVSAAAPPAAARWHRTGLVPMAGPDGSFQIVGGRLYLTDVAAGRRLLSAWTMQPLRRLWTASLPAATTPQGAVLHSGAATVSAAGADVLLRDTNADTILDRRTGAVRWSSPSAVTVLGGRVGLLSETSFRPGTTYDQSSGDPGPLFFDSTGLAHTQPPLRTTLRGVDLASGRPLWSVAVAGAVVTAPASGDEPAVVVVSADRITLRAADTGAVLRERSLAASTGISRVRVVGDLLFLENQDTQARVTSIAYGLDTLDERWELDEADGDGDRGSCTGLPCGPGLAGLAVLDSRTGVPRWQVGRDVDLVARVDGVFETQGDTGAPLRLLDDRTGAVRAALGGWAAIADSAANDPLVLLRSGKGTAFGLLLPGDHAVWPLGSSAEAVEDCSSDERFVVCQAAAGVEIWSYQIS
jgi:hypothetical protein